MAAQGWIDVKWVKVIERKSNAMDQWIKETTNIKKEQDKFLN